MALVMTLAGCATPQEVNKVQFEVNVLRAEVKDLREQVSSPLHKEKIDSLDRKLQDLQNTQDSAAKSVSDLLVQIQSISSEFRVLTGRFEESKYYSEKTATEVTAEKERLAAKLRQMELLIDDLNKRLSQMELSGKEEVKPGEEMKPVDEGKPAGELKKPQEEKKEQPPDAGKEIQDVKDLYLAGYQAYKEGRTVEAREKLSSVLKDYPENEYTDNARFWIAESFYKDGNYEDAILTYEELLKKNPKTDKAPAALLKQGLAFFALKDERTGRIILEKLVEKYPKSEQAQTAKKRLGKAASPKKK